MRELYEEVRKLIKNGTPLEALSLLKRESPKEVKAVIEDIFNNPAAINDLEEQWRDILSLVYYSYFSYISSGLKDPQSVTECVVSSLNATNFAKRLKFPELQFTFLINAGNALNQMAMNDRAIKCFQDAEEIIRKLGNGYDVELAAVLNNIGAVYIESRKIDEAEEYLVKALEIRRKLADEDEGRLPELAETLSNAGALFGDKRNYELSLKYYEESISIFRRLSESSLFHKANLAAALNNFSIVLKRQSRFEDAEKCIVEALEIFRELKEINEGFIAMYARTLDELGKIYNELGKHEEADKCFKEVKEIEIRLTREKKIPKPT